MKRGKYDMKQVNIHEAKTNLSKLINYAIEGEEVIVAKSGKPLVKIIPIKEKGAKRPAGLLKDFIESYEEMEKPLPNKIIKEFYE